MAGSCKHTNQVLHSLKVGTFRRKLRHQLLKMGVYCVELVRGNLNKILRIVSSKNIYVLDKLISISCLRSVVPLCQHMLCNMWQGILHIFALGWDCITHVLFYRIDKLRIKKTSIISRDRIQFIPSSNRSGYFHLRDSLPE